MVERWHETDGIECSVEPGILLKEGDDVSANCFKIQTGVGRHIARLKGLHLITRIVALILQVLILAKDLLEIRVSPDETIPCRMASYMQTLRGKVCLHVMHGRVESGDQRPVDPGRIIECQRRGTEHCLRLSRRALLGMALETTPGESKQPWPRWRFR